MVVEVKCRDFAFDHDGIPQSKGNWETPFVNMCALATIEDVRSTHLFLFCEDEDTNAKCS